MAIARHIAEMMEQSSWIRKMFESGSNLKKQYGAENVFDFSLGNPDIEPPQAFTEALHRVADNTEAGRHGYMPNGGYPFVREAVAEQVTKEYRVSVMAEHIIMTCGAGGAMNIALKAIVNPNEKVLVSAPYFVEYGFYVANHGGILKTVPCTEDFDIDIDAMERNIDADVAAVIINSPNNPSGAVYSRQVLEELADMLRRVSQKVGRTIYLISDEPYRQIVFGDREVPSVLELYEHSMVAYSYSKVLSIPGERIGWLAVNPQAEAASQLVGGAVLSNRIMGFVNAPAVMQRVIVRLQGVEADVGAYERRKRVLCEGLREIGYRFPEPRGAFYLFAEAPGGDDITATNALQEQRILVVPGRGFGCPGYFRISFCVDEDIISRAMPGFASVYARLSNSK